MSSRDFVGSALCGSAAVRPRSPYQSYDKRPRAVASAGVRERAWNCRLQQRGKGWRPDRLAQILTTCRFGRRSGGDERDDSGWPRWHSWGAGAESQSRGAVQAHGQGAARTYRRSGGQRLSSRMGFPVVLLTTRGAKTGLTRTTPVGGFRTERTRGWWSPRSPEPHVTQPGFCSTWQGIPTTSGWKSGRERFKVRGESLEGPERTEALAGIATISARYGTYQQKTDREIPIVRLTREP